MRKLVIQRRASDADGNATGAFAPAFSTWCRWTQSAGAMAAVNGQREDKIDVLASVNTSRENCTISNADRAVLDRVMFEIDSIGLPERKSGTITLMLKRAQNG